MLPLKEVKSNLTGLTPFQDPPSPPHSKSSFYSNFCYSDDDHSFDEVNLNISPYSSPFSVRPTSPLSSITDDPERQPLSLSFLDLTVRSQPPTSISLSLINLDAEKPQSHPLNLTPLKPTTSAVSIQPAEGLENKSTAFNVEMTTQATQVFFKPHKKHNIATNFSPHIHTKSTNTETQLIEKQDVIREHRNPARLSIMPGDSCDIDSLITDLQGKMVGVRLRASQESLTRKGKVTKAKSFSRLRKNVSGLFKSDKKLDDKLKEKARLAGDVKMDQDKFKRARSVVRRSMQMKKEDMMNKRDITSPRASGSGWTP